MGRRPLGEKAMTGAERLRRMRERRRKTKAETKKREVRELERLERLKQKRVAPPLPYDSRAWIKENERLMRQLAIARAANPGGPAEERAAAKLLSEIARLKEALAKAQRETGRLKEKLDYEMSARFQNWRTGDAPKPPSKRDWRAIQRCLHPDGRPTETDKIVAFQFFNQLKLNVTEP